MKQIALLLALAGAFSAAQTAPIPPPPSKPATAAKPGTSASAAKKPATAATTGIKLPPGVPPVKGIVKSAFALRYQDVKIGTGAVAEPLKLYKVHYTGWLASDGKKFDSSFDHRQPIMGKDGKPELDADGKPELGDPQPISFPQGRGRVIPGWDQGFEGMKIGGKRRLFIPYQLAYGVQGRPPVIPAKSDLIFDVELVDVTDMPTPPQGMNPGMAGHPMPPKPATPAGAASPAPAANSSAPAATPSAPATPPATTAPAPKPATPTQPQ